MLPRHSAECPQGSECPRERLDDLGGPQWPCPPRPAPLAGVNSGRSPCSSGAEETAAPRGPREVLVGADRPDGDVAGTCSFQCSLSYCRARSHLPTPWRETPTVLSLSRSAGWPRAAAWPTRSVRCGRGSILGSPLGRKAHGGRLAPPSPGQVGLLPRRLSAWLRLVRRGAEFQERVLSRQAPMRPPPFQRPR